MRLLPITQSILREAAGCATTKLKTPDALHAATAQQAGCVLFVTNDAGFRGVAGLPLVHGNLDNFRRLLRSRRPRRPPAPPPRPAGGDPRPVPLPRGGDKSHQLLDLRGRPQGASTRARSISCSATTSWPRPPAGASARTSGDLNELFRAGVARAYGDRADEIYAPYLRAVRRRPAGRCARPTASSSATACRRRRAWRPSTPPRWSATTPTEADLRPGGSVHALVWGRDTQPDNGGRPSCNAWTPTCSITGTSPATAASTMPNDRQLILDSLGDPAGLLPVPRRPAADPRRAGRLRQHLCEPRPMHAMNCRMPTRPPALPETPLDALGRAGPRGGLHRGPDLPPRPARRVRPAAGPPGRARRLRRRRVHALLGRPLAGGADAGQGDRCASRGRAGGLRRPGDRLRPGPAGHRRPVARACASPSATTTPPPCASPPTTPGSTASPTSTTLQMDWRYPPADRSWPVILASDLIYEMRNVAPLVALVKQLLRRTASAC